MAAEVESMDVSESLFVFYAKARTTAKEPQFIRIQVSNQHPIRVLVMAQEAFVLVIDHHPSQNQRHKTRTYYEIA